MKRVCAFLAALMIGVSLPIKAQTLTFTMTNGQVIAGPKFQYEVWIKSTDGTSHMGSIIAYNNYNTVGFGTNVVANGRAVVMKNDAVFGPAYSVNPSNDNTASRLGYSWTYLGGVGNGVVLPTSGDGVLAFTVQINIMNVSAMCGLSFEYPLMVGEQFKDDEWTIWPVVDATSMIEMPLPIQLASFSATVRGGGRVLLAWATLSETNNYGFEVEKSADSTMSFRAVPNSFIPGHGTTLEPHHYAFTDSSASQGRWWYRLKQIDLNATVHFTDSISVNVLTDVRENPIPTEFALQQNYPNPFNPSTTIHYSTPRTSFVTLTVYNTLGQQVSQLVNEQQQAGYHDVVFRGDRLASGVYFYRIKAGDFIATRKLLYLK
jgi:hypothetical protein